MTRLFFPAAARFSGLLLLALCLALLHVASAAEPDKENVHYVRTLADGAPSIRVFLIDGEEVRDTESLKSFVTKLPKGSILHWDSGCMWYETLPMRGPEVKIPDFKSFCEKQDVQFRYICGY